MLYAIVDGQQSGAFPKASGICPICGEYVRPRCGAINAWHWAHKKRSDCPSSEPETAWHLYWKRQFPMECVEIAVKKRGKMRRADVLLENGTSIEFQHSSISTREIHEREQFWGRLAWVFDVKNAKERFELRYADGYETFRWKYPRKSAAYAECPVWLDIGDWMFSARKIHKGTPCGGWGHLKTRAEFITNLISNNNN